MIDETSLSLHRLRDAFHAELASSVLYIRETVDVAGEQLPVFNNADKDSSQSVDLAARVAAMLPPPGAEKQKGSKTGRAFEQAVLHFIEDGLAALRKVSPWKLHAGSGELISKFSQYTHLNEIQATIETHAELESVIGGDYLVRPDIVVWRTPLEIAELNRHGVIIDDGVEVRSPLVHRREEPAVPVLHGSVSCKWTIRSDRSQNTRTEALNLLRNRKGRTPHIMAVTMEPLPGRLGSVAMGTGDIDCVYHAALDELLVATESGAEERGASWIKARDRLRMMIESRRIRDILDLPLDLMA